MEQTSSSKNAVYLQNPVTTLQATRLFNGAAITLPPEILNSILRLVKDRNSLLVCRLVNNTWNQFLSSILQSDYEITIHFKKRRQFSLFTALKIVPWSKLPLFTSLKPSSNFPCRNFLFQGVRIGENESFNCFLRNYGDRILKLEFEECEFPHSCAHMVEEKGRSCYQAFVYWVMQKVPNLTHFYCTENTFFANKKLAPTNLMTKDIEKIYFQHLSEFHFRPDDYNELKYFPTSSTNLNDRMNYIFVGQILAHSPNVKKYFSRPSIKKVDELNNLLDVDNVAKLKQVFLFYFHNN